MRVKVFLYSVLYILLVSVNSFAVEFKPGAALRLRHEYWKNIFDMENTTKDNRDYFRFRTSIWGDLKFTEDVSLFTKLTDEFKAYTYYYQSASRKKDLHFDIDEMVFDNLYLDVKNTLGFPVDLRLGRQDLTTYGEGFLLMDGTPSDGSRTYYFNAAKASWNIDEDNSLDFMYINDHREDDILPSINEKVPHQQINATDEEAGVLYLKSKAIEKLYLEGYYIYKIEDLGGAGLQARKTELNTIGSYAKYTFAPWTLRGQLAGQFGDYGTNDREGLGGYMYLDRDFADIMWTPKLTVGYIYLSGDDPSTSENEAWDPLFSRYPWISDAYSLHYSTETGISSYWTNLQAYRLDLSLKLNEKTKFDLGYNYLRANENPSGTVFSTGKTRGHLPKAKLSYNFNKNISTYIQLEYFVPGSFYVDAADDALFLRTEMMIKF